MKIVHGLKYTFLVLTFVSLSPLQGASKTQLSVSDGVVGTAIGGAFLTAGLCILNEIPLTSLDEISLSFRNQLSKENLRKLRIGRAIQGYTLTGIGAVTSFLGICTILAAAARK